MAHSHTQLIQQALKLQTSGRFKEATQIYLQVLNADPHNFDALHLSGAAALEIGDLDNAELLIKQALSHGNYAGSAMQRHRRLGDAHNNLAITLQKQGKLDAALISVSAALTHQPDSADLLTNRGAIHKMLGQYPQAEADLRRAIKLNPQHVKALVALGIVLYVTGHWTEAEQHIDIALRLKPEDAPAHCNKGILCAARNDTEAALLHYEESLRIDPRYEDAWHNRAVLRLALGRFREGWPDRYLHDPPRRGKPKKPPLPQDLRGQRVCVRRNQGIGDEMFFMRFIPLLKQRGAEVIYQTETRMLSFAKRVANIDAVLEPEAALVNMTYVVAVDYLPYYLELGDADIPTSIKLMAEPTMLQRAALALMQAGPPPYLGITWRAGRLHADVDFRKEATEILFKDVPIELLAEAIHDWPGTILMLQRKPLPEEITRFQQALAQHTPGRSAVDFTAANDDLEYMLALLSLIERYVAVSNTNLHLREAAGLPTHVLVPWPPEWRWGFRTDNSPWFPHCPTYRQTVEGDWQPALQRLHSELLR